MHELIHAGLASVALFLASPAAAQDAEAPSTDREDVARSHAAVRVVGATETSREGPTHARSDAQAHGRLSMLRIDVDCLDADPREARRAFAKALGLNLVDHFPRDREATLRVDLELRDVPAVEALEILLGYSFSAGAPTWQVRQGILEVGPRDRLATRTAPIVRVIDVTDMLLEPPDFVSPEHLWRGVTGNQTPGLSSRPDPLSETFRRNPREIGAELIRSIVDGVEPDAWHPLSEEDRQSGLPDPVDARDPFQGRNLDAKAVHPETRTRAPIFVQGRWASIKLHDRGLVFRGPAFVLRGIEGLPKPVPPPASLVPRHR